MLDTLKELTCLDGVSGEENAVRDYIISKIDGHCEYSIDPLGSIIAFKKGKNRSVKKLMVDAHMDEVGLIITSITSDGFLGFSAVGGIDTAVLMFRRVRIGNINGVITGKPVHLISAEERKKLPKADSLYIDIGANSKEEALKLVRIGDKAVICGEYVQMGNKIKAKAIDDRVGCAILISLLTKETDYDFYAAFSVQEEVGLRGAKAVTFTVDPDSAIILEATTAADIAGVEASKRVCVLGEGPAVSFMDRATVYDRAYYDAALKSGIKCQPKAAVAGGNNSGSVHLSRGGVRTLAISVPCRYIHSPSCVADTEDIENAEKLSQYMINGICSGKIK
ncbi:MAG: M42 family peptidase [Acutalibacteraceae bacterium]|nr:M42 family peptidase [Acutalibacteraceae bacterium]